MRGVFKGIFGWPWLLVLPMLSSAALPKALLLALSAFLTLVSPVVTIHLNLRAQGSVNNGAACLEDQQTRQEIQNHARYTSEGRALTGGRWKRDTQEMRARADRRAEATGGHLQA